MVAFRTLLKEDGKLEHTVASMRSEKEQADRQLFGTMDRVSCHITTISNRALEADTKRGRG